MSEKEIYKKVGQFSIVKSGENSTVIDSCPRCKSNNTHDCEAYNEEQDSGSTCHVAQRIDDITIGHCDNCGYIWCLECMSELSINNTVCGHWGICDKCSVEPKDCEYQIKPGKMYRCPLINRWKNKIW